MKQFSIIIPVYNESLNIETLYREITKSISNNLNYEVIFVDDASTDDTNNVLKRLSKNKNVISIKHKVNLGQSRSIQTGIVLANYKTIVTIDGDGQNNPKDIDKLLTLYFNSDYKLVGGIRYKRKDNLIKIISSRFANFVRTLVLKDNCKDTGCSLKVLDRDIFLLFPFFDGIHRFLPALFKGFGYNTKFVLVDHRPRLKGISKYGTLDRLYKGVLDLVRVKIIIYKKNKL